MGTLARIGAKAIVRNLLAILMVYCQIVANYHISTCVVADRLEDVEVSFGFDGQPYLNVSGQVPGF